MQVALLVALVLAPTFAWPQGTPLGPEFRINSYTAGFQFAPSVAVPASGNFVVVWTSAGQDGSSGGVFGQRYASSGAPLGPEFRVNTYTTDPQFSSYTSVASDPSGNFVVVWQSLTQDGSSSGVFGQRYASSGAPLGSEFRVNTYTTNSQNIPAVAVDPSGNFVVVWVSDLQDGSSGGVFGQRYASSGASVGPEFRINSYTTGLQFAPSVAADDSGNFVVVWETNDPLGIDSDIFGQRYASSGTPLGPEFRVNTYTTDSQSLPVVGADPFGNFVVVWTNYQDGSVYGVFGQRYASSGAPLGPEFRVNSYTPGIQMRPSVAADGSGNFVVVWRSDSQDGSSSGVFGQRYASSGTPLGPEFRVNTYTTNAQAYSGVASDPSGNFVVVWQSNTQDGSSYGIFGQRYSQIVPVELLRFGVE